MNENVSPSQTDPNIQTAVLLLPAEPDWYWQNLAEVPFLLRNALTLQRAGIKNLLIWMQSPTEKMDAIHQKLKQDRRMGLDVEWITDNTSGLQDTNFMVLDGVHPARKIRSRGSDGSIQPISSRHLRVSFFPRHT